MDRIFSRKLVMKIAFKTFGCRANSVDTDVLWMEAQRRGFTIVEEKDIADAYVINSCTVTHNADRDANVQARKYKRQNPNALVGMVGCYSQMAATKLEKNTDIDFVLGTSNKFEILNLLEKSTAPSPVLDPTGFLPETFLGSLKARAPIKIQDGCNFKCSFCIIPNARGRSKSLPVEVVLNQVRAAYAQGYEEVVLTGIHLAHFGWDQNTDLLNLLRRLLSEKQGPRIRLSTLDPFEIPDELVDLLDHPRLCPYFHIALQSGSDNVLSQMRRIYKAQEFIEVTQKIYNKNKNTFIGVDVIVGFPGETERYFQETVRCLNSSYWTKLHVFPFSVREGTLAEQLADKVPSKIISQRSQALRQMSEGAYQTFLKDQLGQTRETVLEKKLPGKNQAWTGHTDNYIPTLLETTLGKAKSKVRVRLNSVDGDRVWTQLQP